MGGECAHGPRVSPRAAADSNPGEGEEKALTIPLDNQSIMKVVIVYYLIIYGVGWLFFGN